MHTIIDRKIVPLKAKQPEKLFPQGGIDILEAEFTFEFNSLPPSKKLSVRFADADGRSAREIIDLSNSTPFMYKPDASLVEHSGGITNFGQIEFICDDDFTFGVSAHIPEGPFF